MKNKSLERKFEDLRGLSEEEMKEVFSNHGTPWLQDDLDYLMQYYRSDGSVDVAYALGRTPFSVQQMHQDMERKLGVKSRPIRKLTDQNVLDIRTRIQQGDFMTNIAKDYDVNWRLIFDIKHRRIHKGVQ